MMSKSMFQLNLAKSLLIRRKWRLAGFNPETRKKMVYILEDSYAELELELAIIIDVETDIVRIQ